MSSEQNISGYNWLGINYKWEDGTHTGCETLWKAAFGRKSSRRKNKEGILCKFHVTRMVDKTVKVKCYVTGPVVAQRVGRGIALLFHDRGTRRVSSTSRPYFTPGKDPIPIVQEAGWAPGPVWTGRKSRPTGIRSPDRPARSQSLYRLS